MVDDRLASFISLYRKHDDPRVTQDRATSCDPAHRGYCVGVATQKKILCTYNHLCLLKYC